MLELERDLIYIVPLKKNYRPWVRAEYAKWKAGGEQLPDSMREMCEGIERDGGINPFVGAVPVEIVGEGRG